MSSIPHPPRLLLLGSNHPTTWIVYNRLVREFGLFDAIIEEPVSKWRLLRVRARKLGWPKVISQVGFVALLRPILSYQSSKRVHAICRRDDLETKRPYTPAIRDVSNINAPETIEMIAACNPDLVIVNGTRILKPSLLNRIKVPIINSHHGITPMYRGAHGGYWALHEKDPANCGVTVHLIDEGIDTGSIISQALISPEAIDTYISYPYLQIAAALPLLVATVQACARGELKTFAKQGLSRIWYHPGFFQYIIARLRGVR
ncbi:MAG: formyl transferase [Phyllobacteriaceae bacterium]|nr:formyl transferase [Phyllobacteriaceae bacterium]